MKYGSVCSGIEAASVAWEPLGWRAQFFAEIEKFPAAVLAHHWPQVPNYGDMTKFKGWPDATIDVLVGGTPCQSFSVAGLRKGLADPRGNLALTYLGIADRYRPRWLVWENVPGVLSSNGGRDFGAFVGALGQLGYGWAYRVLDAQFYGVAQRRRRVFVVGYLGDWRRAAAVLFERESLRGDPAPRRETRQDPAADAGCGFEAAGALDARATAGGFPGTDGAASGHVIPVPEYEPVGALTDGAHNGGGLNGQDAYSARIFAVKLVTPILEAGARMGVSTSDPRAGVGIGAPGDPMFTLQAGKQHAVAVTGQITHALNTANNGKGSSEDSTGRRVPVIAFSSKDFGADAMCDLSPTLRAGGHAASHANSGVPPAVTVAIRGRDGGVAAELGGEVATALRASQGGGDKPHILAVCERQGGYLSESDVASALVTGGGKPGQGYAAVRCGLAVRRLMPAECERLQGFPDGHTDVPWRGKDSAPDGPRYKAIGNSMAVPVMRWIGERIAKVDAM